MIERFNIDVVAEAITSDVMSGSPKAKLAHRFFRKGRRDGKRQLNPAPVEQLVVMAVGVARSRVQESYFRQRDELNKRRATAQQSVAGAQARLAAAPGVPLPPVPAAVGASATDDVDAAMQHARRVMEDRRAAAAAHEIMQKARQERDTDEKVVSDGLIEIESISEELDSLGDRFAQQITTCGEVGGLLWARYVTGYEYGQTRRWRRAKTRREVSPSIVFVEQQADLSAPVREGVA